MKFRLLLLGCVCIWGWTFVATRICLEVLRPIDVVALRSLIGLPILFGIVRLERLPLGLSRREAPRLGLAAGVLTVHFLIQAVALGITSATHTGWIIAVTPLVIALASHLVLGEAIGRRQVVGGSRRRRSVAALLFLGILGTAAQWGWQEGSARLGATRVGLFLYLEPIATTALAVPLLGESYGPATAVGGLMILAGVWWAERAGRG